MLETQPLGASLYVPATHKDLLAIASGDKLGALRSVIVCTEDSVAEHELSLALFNLARTLKHMARASPALRFVRARNPAVLARVLAMPGADTLTGFVLPKLTRLNFDAYFRLVRRTPHLLMPTLETGEVFDDREMILLRRKLAKREVRERILALRIGGNDLLALLGIRRPRTATIYRTALGSVIARLVTTFRPHGFQLTAPVFEYLDRPELLEQEIAEDLAHGLFGKTAIHPDQVPLIERHYRVREVEVEMARRILEAGSPAVFCMDGSMCEVATHRGWAEGVLSRVQTFGMACSELGI